MPTIWTDIIAAAKSRGINPFTTPFKPIELGLRSSDYGSFSDFCDSTTTTSGKWNHHIVLKVVEFTKSGRPLRYVLLPVKG